jgi:phage tail sheath protein FI
MIDKYDRDYLEPFGYNSIIERPATGQIMIYSNATAFQLIKSDFNNLHVRDLLITVEEAIEDILSNYVFDFNEDSIRLEIKTLVDNYLSGVKSVGGIYNYLTIMDSSNNTPAIIDQNLGIIDVIVEPARGIHKFINRVTVTRTGGISSGGFIQFS